MHYTSSFFTISTIYPISKISSSPILETPSTITTISWGYHCSILILRGIHHELVGQYLLICPDYSVITSTIKKIACNSQKELLHGYRELYTKVEFPINSQKKCPQKTKLIRLQGPDSMNFMSKNPKSYLNSWLS